MDAKTHLDPEVAAALQASPFGKVDIGSLEFSGLPALREAMATMPRPPLPPTRTVYRDHTIAGRGRSARRHRPRVPQP